MRIDPSKMIAQLNDAFRAHGAGGLVPGKIAVANESELSDFELVDLMKQVCRVRLFDVSEDPLGYHECGLVTSNERRYRWRFHYFADDTCTVTSTDPGNINKCFRVLSITQIG